MKKTITTVVVLVVVLLSVLAACPGNGKCPNEWAIDQPWTVTCDR